MNYKRFTASLAAIAGILTLSSVLVFAQQGTSGTPSQRMGPGMMGGYGMMTGPGAMGPGMMGGPGAIGPGMMAGPGAMMDGPMMQLMMSDPKTRGQMLEIHGRAMKEMGELMEKRGQELEQGK
jgi:hypothetical protein